MFKKKATYISGVGSYRHMGAVGRGCGVMHNMAVLGALANEFGMTVFANREHEGFSLNGRAVLDMPRGATAR